MHEMVILKLHSGLRAFSMVLFIGLICWLYIRKCAFLLLLNELYLSISQDECVLLQGTGSAGATIRIYVEQFEPDVSKHHLDAQLALKPLIGEYHFLKF